MKFLNLTFALILIPCGFVVAEFVGGKLSLARLMLGGSFILAVMALVGHGYCLRVRKSCVPVRIKSRREKSANRKS